MSNTSRLKFMWLNCENLFLLSDQPLTPQHLAYSETEWRKLSTSLFDNKPLSKTKELAKIILSESPDIISLAEVGGIESLQNFSRLFLQEKYSPALLEGNSDRNIDLGYLIKKDLPFYFDLISNRNRPLEFLYAHERQKLEVPNIATDGKWASHKFSRDLTELHLFVKDRSKPFLVCLGVHLKSRLDPDGVDPNGFSRREAEVKTLIKIVQELERDKPNIPIVLMGDFNGNASETETDLEFRSIYEHTKLRDVGGMAQLSKEARATYYNVQRNALTEGKQLDYAFLNTAAQPLLDIKSVNFFRYLDEYGLKSSPPTTIDAKFSLPSDHDPIFFAMHLELH